MLSTANEPYINSSIKNQRYAARNRSREEEERDHHIVCRVIGPENLPVGTGFLVGPDLILTCYHVYYSLSGEDQRIQGFDPEPLIKSHISNGRVFVKFGDDARFDFSLSPVICSSLEDELDYVILQLNRQVGPELAAKNHRHRWRNLFTESPSYVGDHSFRDRVQFVHYPHGYEEYVTEDAEIFRSPDQDLFNRYIHTGLSHPGSSGAPIVSITSGQLIAIHKGVIDAAGKKLAIPVSLIRDHIEKSGYKDLLNHEWVDPNQENARRAELIEKIYSALTKARVSAATIQSNYVKCLPPRSVHILPTAQINHTLMVIEDLMEYDRTETGRIPVLDFLQILRAQERKLRNPLKSAVELICAFYEVGKEVANQIYSEMRQSVERSKPLLVLKIATDNTTSPPRYTLMVKTYSDEEQVIPNYLSTAGSVQDETELANLLTKELKNVMSGLNMSSEQRILIAVPKELLPGWALNIDKLGLQLTDSDNSYNTLNECGIITYTCTDHWTFEFRRHKLKERWKDIETTARVSRTQKFRADEDIRADLEKYNQGKWVSCLVENRGLGQINVANEMLWLFDTGTPSLVWTRVPNVKPQSLLPERDFSQAKLLHYASELHQKIRGKSRINPIVFLLDNPKYYERDIV